MMGNKHSNDHSTTSRPQSFFASLACKFFAIYLVFFTTTVYIELRNNNIAKNPSQLETVKVKQATSTIKSQHIVTEESEVETSALVDKIGESVNISSYSTKPYLTLTAYLEPILQYWKDGNDKDFGTPIEPIPLRTQSPSDLTRIEYPQVNTCADIPHKFPIIRGLEEDPSNPGELLFKNVNNNRIITDEMLPEQSKVCPVDADPFLPWIHDVFLNKEDSAVTFIVQNKRRCNQADKFRIEKDRLIPQLSLLQPISVVPVLNSKDEIPSTLWDDNNNQDEKRWKLSTLQETQSEDHKYTRFICRFKSVSTKGEGNSFPIRTLGETLSRSLVNYEWVNFRKRRKTEMLTKEGIDKEFFWLSSYQFECPLPPTLDPAVMQSSQYNYYVDVIPIRTPPRTGTDGLHFDPNNLPRRFRSSTTFFDATKKFGTNHVLPKIEASGRWENIPICDYPSSNPKAHQKITEKNTPALKKVDTKTTTTETEKPYYLVGCLWASAVYGTRGNLSKVSDTKKRLKEWLEYHFLAGFDHFYIYDNTAAQDASGNISLSDELRDLFDPSQITHIEWPFRVCNNNIPAHKNTGERSSQYAAEASCRARYGKSTTWMASFDPDEYFLPSGKYKDLKEFLSDVSSKEDTNILSFRSVRGSLVYNATIPYYNNDTRKDGCGEKPSEQIITQSTESSLNSTFSNCVAKDPSKTYLEAYNCDVSIPKPNWAERAKKQIFKADYVLSHFVHYSTITQNTILSSSDRNFQVHTHQDKTERFVDEEKEAYMMHAKTYTGEETIDWSNRCNRDMGWKKDCRLGFPFPPNHDSTLERNKDGMKYNCYAHPDINEYWVPRVEKALKERYGR